MTHEQKALARLDKAREELRAAQAEVDRLRSAYMVRKRCFGLNELAYRREVA